MDDAALNPVLRCSNIDKHFPLQSDLRLWRILTGIPLRGEKIQALSDISLDVPRGKIVGILGKNGAGKSTLLRVLGGVYPPTSGQVEVSGQVGSLFELGGMGNGNLSGRQYARQQLSMLEIPDSEVPALIEDILEFSELGEAFENSVRTYSSGMRARLYFSVATVQEHEIYLIDELLSVGDEHFVAKCWQRMRERLLNGASGVLVTHDWEAILRLCEHSYVMEQGRFVFSGPSDQAVVSYLNITQPEPTVARIMDQNGGQYVVTSGEDASLRFWIDVMEAEPVDFALSIEVLRIGIGWEIVILEDGIAVADQPGSYVVDIQIPDFPLAPGEYSLNLFLSQRKVTPQDSAKSYDLRSWTTGNGCRLVVEGEVASELVRLPFLARKPGASV